MSRKVPKLRVELVRVQYWECLDAGHRHQTEEIAAKCIAKALRPKMAVHHWTPAERQDVLNRFRAGERQTDIGRGYGVSGNRIHQVIFRAERERWAQDRAPDRAEREGGWAQENPRKAPD